ncbi:MAG: UvrD-helicase domain-containing protein [candidate division WOR-3 bacterium]|nr:UvrD-helicase domain-containing protein [candidate division WOR-3 bacterium]MDW8114154.1 UvrD-helicase domain-containing protein [candidate division WOR-3 bacterium]
MKARLILAPAGSGKTKRLAENYLELLKKGVPIEKILAITFTEKAAYEMKERIFKMAKEDKEVFKKLKENLNKIRISTIDSFCLSLIKRFSFFLNLSSYLDVIEYPRNLYEKAIANAFRSLKENEKLYKFLLDFFIEFGFKGYERLKKYFLLPFFEKRLFSKRAELEENREINRSRELGNIAFKFFKEKVEKIYEEEKLKREILDFSDLELYAYFLLNEHPEFNNILDAFDERTDHILVDEFQDTNYLQWAIIDKLTEEWRAGKGRKNELGIIPSLFLVGDEKQSIYYFRGANVEIVNYAQKKLKEWLSKNFQLEVVQDNYRSLKAIIDFTNILFSEIFGKDYVPFLKKRNNEAIGNVEIILIEANGNTETKRKLEAEIICKKIKSIVNNLELYSLNEEKRYLCDYKDITILIRKRTHLKILEEKLREYDIPFVVVKGTGFYDEPEIQFLISFLRFLSEPTSSYNLYLLLKSPLFNFDDEEIIKINQEEGLTLYEKLLNYYPHCEEKRKKDIQYLKFLLREYQKERLSIFVERVLRERSVYKYLKDPQRKANVKKFLNLLEKLESENQSLLGIIQFFQFVKEDEPKANINTEEMNVVKIMTIHEAKGLQFPVVFLPFLDEPVSFRLNQSFLFIEEDENRVRYVGEGIPEKRKSSEDFKKHQDKEKEEEKRIFYVAVTRAQDALYLSGVLSNNINESKLLWLIDKLQIKRINNHYELEKKIEGVKVLTKEEIEKEYEKVKEKKEMKKEEAVPIIIEKVEKLKRGLKYIEVTEILPKERKRHSLEWIIFGEVFHTILDEISKGYLNLDEKEIEKRGSELLKKKGIGSINLEKWVKIILEHYQKLKEKDLLKIVERKENSFSELPFILKKGNKFYSGRIDKIIVEDDKIYLYDYKTFPVEEKDIERIARSYLPQLKIYELALKKIFNKKVEKYIIFTSRGKLIPVA